MIRKFEESIHQEFERFMRDEMDDSEKNLYLKTQRYENMINQLSKILIEKSLKKRIKFIFCLLCYLLLIFI